MDGIWGDANVDQQAGVLTVLMNSPALSDETNPLVRGAGIPIMVRVRVRVRVRVSYPNPNPNPNPNQIRRLYADLRRSEGLSRLAHARAVPMALKKLREGALRD